MINYPIVWVKWVDSYGCGSAWEEISDIEPIPHYCYSVGYLVAESKDCIVVVPHMSPKNTNIGSEENGCGDMTIPVCAIVEWRDLV